MRVFRVNDRAAIRIWIGGIKWRDRLDAEQKQRHEDHIQPMGSEHERPQWRGWDLRLHASRETKMSRDHRRSVPFRAWPGQAGVEPAPEPHEDNERHQVTHARSTSASNATFVAFRFTSPSLHLATS